MKLIIRIKNGAPFEHPIFEDNFIAAFPQVDINNLNPEEFALFERKPTPEVSAYQILENVTYEPVSGIYTDVFHIRDLNENEKQAKIAAAQALPHPDGFVFNYEACRWEAPLLTNDGTAPNVIA
jgi:hypothetical protein